MIKASILRIYHLSEFEQLQRPWEEVFQRCRNQSVFASFEYARLWFHCFAKNNSIWVVSIYDDCYPIAFVPLFHFHRCGIRFLTGLTNDHCMHSNACVAEEAENIFPNAFLKAIIDNRQWDILDIRFIYSFLATPLNFSVETLTSHSMRFQSELLPNFSVSLNRSFEYYLSKDISRKLRSTYNRCRKRLEQSGKLIFRHAKDRDAQLLWSVFLQLEASGWKGRAGSSIDSLSLDYRFYYLELLNILSRNGLLHLFLLELDGKPIAASFGYSEGCVLHGSKMGYDESYSAFSPSTLLMLFIVDNLINYQPKIRLFNLFPWDYGYKHRFVNDQSFCREIRLYNKTKKASALWRIDQLKKNLRYRYPHFMESIKELLLRTVIPHA